MRGRRTAVKSDLCCTFPPDDRQKVPRPGTNSATFTCAAWLLAPHAAGADPLPEPIRFAYVAPRGCPEEARFRDGVAARTAKFRQAAPSEPPRLFAGAGEGDAEAAS